MQSGTPKLLSEEILREESPSAALALTARIIDQLADRIDALEKGGSKPVQQEWDTWDEPAKEEEWLPNPDDEVELAALKEALQGNGNADESRVLRARIELCEDRLKPPLDRADNTGNATVAHYDEAGNAIIDLPKPTTTQLDYRAKLLPRLGLKEQYGDDIGSKTEDSFLRGGPLLLYYSDREFVNALPSDVKQYLVADVEESSPREAHEMARDILKVSTDQANDLVAAQERIFGDVESGAIHNG